MRLAERYQQVMAWFENEMPAPEPELHFSNPFELIVAVLLSAQCTDKRINQVTPSLFASYPDAWHMSQASVEDILHYIKSVSYPNSKAAHLQAMAQALVRDFGGEVPNTLDELVTLPGVGRKTASVVMAVAFDEPAMPVDTHVFRVSHRLGLAPKSADTPLKTEKYLTKYIPRDDWGRAHHQFLLHGRYVCLARNPKCAQCGLSTLCPSCK